MQQILSDLYNYILESTPPIRNDPAYEKALQTCEALEKIIQEKTGSELFFQYQCAVSHLRTRQELAAFSHALRLSGLLFRGLFS